MTNEAIARSLDAVADLLGVQHANLHRIRAWQHAAAVVRDSDVSVAQLIRRKAAIPGVGASLRSAIRELVERGRLRTLERLEGEVNPEQVLLTVPGLGPQLAQRIHAELGIATLEELEEAAHDGRLENLDGFGERRTRAVRETLAGMLGRAGRSLARQHPSTAAVPVAVLLDVDAEYRRRAAAGELPTLTPRRFNPRHEKWLPILHTERGGRPFTALFSNTAHAHDRGKTRDWVVIYWDGEHGAEARCTVVTETRGPLAGRRVVRGREHESRSLDATGDTATP